ncbi:hypothetical protein KKF97_06275, partial [Myxococcota bacterium]|nr:hypothetical protein [Myxococcota bacterium]
LKRKENVWSNDKASLPELGDSNDTIMKIVYTVLNPVKAGLVPLPTRWPGVKLLPTDIDKEIVVERPEKFFRKKNSKLPEKVTIKLCVPKDYGNTVEGKYNYLAKYKERLDSELAIIMAERKPGDRWLGVEKIKKVSPFSSPKTDSPLWRLKPNFLSAEKPKRIEMWKKWKSFQIYYRIAFDEFRNGNRDVEFPLGTYKMRLQQNVRVTLEHVIYEISPPFE